MAESSIQLIWKDRKRIFGLPITFTKYSLSADRLFQDTGLLNLRHEEILLYRVRDISLNRTLGQRIFGVGSVVIQSSDKTQPMMELKSIKDPMKIKELIHHSVEEMKLKRKMRVGEILEDDSCMNDTDGDDEMEDLRSGC